MRRGRSSALAVCVIAAVTVGCGGGGKSARQDADEPKGTWTVDVVEASFPESQKLAEATEMNIRVRNRSDRTLPNLAVTVEGFGRASQQSGLADSQRPVWIVDDAPRGGVTAYTNTWALGKVPAGKTKTFTWKVTPVRAGKQKINWRVAAGLDGKAKARLAGGKRAEGTFDVNISREPAQSRVDPETGDVIRD